MSSTLATEKQSIRTEYGAIIKDYLRTYRIGKGVREYERAKRMILHGDMSADEVWKATKIIAEWTEV